MRGPARHFTHSKVMAWVAADRAVKAVERFGARGPGRALARSCATRIHADVCANGFDPERNSFVQYYGGKAPRRRAADDPAGRLPAARRPAHGRHGRGDPARADPRRPGAALLHRGGGRRPAARRGHVPHLLLLAGRQPRDARPPRRGARAVRASARRCATTSACWRRSTTRSSAASSATSRRRSPTSA